MPGPNTPYRIAELGSTCCPNCGTRFADLYCPHCAQPAGIGIPTVRDFIGDFVDKLLAVQGRLPLTLKVLLLRPGGVTADYLAGRRARYLKPLNLYVAVTVLFFLVLSLVPGVRVQLGWTLQVTTLATPASSISADTGIAAVDRRVATFGALPADRQQMLLRDGMIRNAPRAMFLLIPLFAALLAILYWHRTYGEHLLFALHFHSFAFLALLPGLVPWPEPLHELLNDAISLLLIAYLYAALRRVYQGGHAGTAIRVGAIVIVYTVTLTWAAVAAVALSVGR